MKRRRMRKHEMRTGVTDKMPIADKIRTREGVLACFWYHVAIGSAKRRQRRFKEVSGK
jgi:hypothetical protein